MRARAFVFALALMTLVACGGDELSSLPDGTPAPTPNSPCQRISVEGDLSVGVKSVTARRVGPFERLEIAVDADASRPPSYELVYVRPPFGIEGSGRTVDVKGRRFIRVIVHEPQVTPSSEDNRVSISKRAFETFKLIEDVQYVPGPSAASSWVVGLRQTACPQAAFLLEPPRLVVDFRPLRSAR